MRFIAVVVFALAVTGATLAGSGLVVAPHVDPPGTPKYHDHVLAAYRLPIFLANMQARFDPRRGVLTEHLADVATFSFVLALLVFVWPRLPRPARRPLAELVPIHIAGAQWRPVLVLGPPRT
jgi:hypothetical protein